MAGSEAAVADTEAMASPDLLSSFTLEPAVVAWRWEDGNIERRMESHFLDFLIAGRSLRDMAGGGADMVTPLCRPWIQTVPDEIACLLGQREVDGLQPDRVALLLCKVDGDLGCGALTARLHVEARQVSWSDWLWESFGEPTPVPQLTTPLIFDRGQYETALRTANERVSRMPYDHLAHHGRNFLWPWQWGWRLP